MKNARNNWLGKRGAVHGCVLAMSVMLAACGGDKEANKPAGQSMARVNGEDITVHQLNAELERVPPGQPVSRKEVLDGLIGRQLLLQQAKKEKADRDPRVLQAIERSKEQILAQHYLQAKIGKPARPSEAEVEKFYEDNPVMFAQRKLFDTRELTIATRDLSAELVQKMEAARSLDEVERWLDAHGVKYVPAQAIRNSAELPPQLVEMLEKIPTGKPFTVRQGEQSQLAVLQDVRSSPLTLAMARPRIEQYLQLQKSREAGEAEIARLRTESKVEYLNGSDHLDEAQGGKENAATPQTGGADPAKDVGHGVAGLGK